LSAAPLSPITVFLEGSAFFPGRLTKEDFRSVATLKCRKAWSLEAWNLEAWNLEAWNVEAWNLEAWNLVAWNLVAAQLLGAELERAVNEATEKPTDEAKAVLVGALTPINEKGPGASIS
jgi:hypothetical protein